MFVNDKLKLNKFKLVSIPTPKQYFGRYGYLTPNPSSYSGDELAAMPQSKIDMLASMDNFNRLKLRDEDNARLAAERASSNEQPINE